MVAKSVKWALASLVIALPSGAFALGLGDVRLLSSLNAPLDAEIELIGATPEEMAVLKAQLASRELFARNGLDLPTSVGNITITPQTKPDGKPVLRMRSTQAVTDPFLTLLVEVDALRTHTVREYTLLLDPPVFAPGAQQNAQVTAPSTSAGAREGAIARQATPAPTESRRPAEPASGSSAPSRTSAPTPRPSSGASAAEGGSRTVQRGDTLSGIANEVSSDPAQTRAWMLAIYQNNPSAFDSNMNVLRSGAVLRIPNASAVAAIAPSEATAEIRRQYASWRGGAAPASESEPGRLRLVPPGAPGGATAPNAQADAALQGRVRDLESQLQESKRLLEARNAELAQLQARLANQPAAAPTPAPAARPTPPPPAAVQPPAETAPPPAAEATPPPAEQPPATAQETPPPAQEAQPAPTVVKRPTPAAAPAEEGGGIFDMLKEYWWALAALVVVILGLFGVKAMRARKQNDFDDSLSRLAGAAAGADALDHRDTAGDTQPLRAQSRESAFVVEESGTHERPRFVGGTDYAPAPTPRNVAADETISSETAINLDQGDPLAEADFHMAYGLYDQAADLVRIAISREPDRRDLKLKLLEVFFVWGNKDQFLQTAHELAETRERSAPGEWEKIVIMGKQLAPEDSLFSGSGGGAAVLGMDLDLEGGQDRVDFDILGDPVSPSSGGGIDLDIGSALGESGSDGSSATVTDANLALHEDGFTADDAGTGITREMTQNLRGDNSPTVQQYGADLEAPTVEQPGLYSGSHNPTIRQKVESAMKQGGLAAADQTAELAIDDLGLDLGALEEHPNLNSTQEAPTLVAGLDERSRRIMDEAERRGGMKDVDATAIVSTGAWNLSGDDLDQTMPPHQIGGYSNGEGSETSRLAALKGGDNDLDFNFNDEEPSAASAASARGYTNGSGAVPDIDLDVGTATVPDTAFTATQKLSSEDLALPDLEPVTMSEVGTKLDLARAYMDMGDPEGARNILEEVMTEGSLAQKQEAQRLLESLPG